MEELWGLAAHPSGAQFVTCGHDKLVHLWSVESHQPLWSRTIEVRAQGTPLSSGSGLGRRVEAMLSLSSRGFNTLSKLKPLKTRWKGLEGRVLNWKDAQNAIELTFQGRCCLPQSGGWGVGNRLVQEAAVALAATQEPGSCGRCQCWL